MTDINFGNLIDLVEQQAISYQDSIVDLENATKSGTYFSETAALNGKMIVDGDTIRTVTTNDQYDVGTIVYDSGATISGSTVTGSVYTMGATDSVDYGSGTFDMASAAADTANIQVAQATLEYAQGITKGATDLVKAQAKKLQQ